MSEFALALATAADDREIRALLRDAPVPGRIAVAYEREPDSFLGCATTGRLCQVFVARHRPTGRVAAVACRAARPLFVNGEPEEVGYLGQLRVRPEHRGRFVVSQGFRFLRELHGDGRVAGYLTTVVDGNAQAVGVLVDRPLRHFPRYREVDRLWTLAYPAPRRRVRPPEGGTSRRATAADLPRIVSFLRTEGRRRQFFPVWSEEDFGSPATRGFRVEDFVLVEEAGDLRAVGGLWDQSAYKQTVVRAYSGALRWLRPLVNALAVARGARRPLLPRPGGVLRSAYGSFLCVKDDDPETFRSLLGELKMLAGEWGHAVLLVGLCGRDPLLAPARSFPHVAYPSRLYTVAWDGGEFHDRFDDRAPYVDVAAL